MIRRGKLTFAKLVVLVKDLDQEERVLNSLTEVVQGQKDQAKAVESATRRDV